MPAEQGEARQRNELREPHEAERQTAAVFRDQQRDVPEDGGRLHQAAGKRDQQSDPEQAKVSMFQCDEAQGTPITTVTSFFHY